ncbi:PEFG-CTERM sorting domain-containing protein [Nitrosopumilus sp.]|uniref:PEFG-CTERM sorting domain-containing protein n=1 Tax=Nitrosopumilus sp. TaxID=2024843 RepID=UPI003D1113A0
MKTIAICSFFVLFAMVAGLVATTPAAYADHSEVTIVPADGSGAPGCEETADGCYIPTTATVDVGGVVIMSNTDTAAHTYTSGNPSDGPDGIFDTSLLMAGSSFEWSPDTVGEYPYFCMVHPWMIGTIIVQEVGAAEDDHGDDHGDEMMMMPEGDATATGMLSDGTMVSIWASAPTAGEAMEISIEFADAEHVNHDIMVTQDGEEVLNDEGAHHHEGTGMHTTAPLSSSDPVDITITFQGYGIDEKTGPIGEEVVFTNVVPEFGTIAMMILAVAIISIVAVTAKSRVIPRF